MKFCTEKLDKLEQLLPKIWLQNFTWLRFKERSKVGTKKCYSSSLFSNAIVVNLGGIAVDWDIVMA